tara:strand:- start:413 stop:1558 length:1146 start_codon:yes stop_codon:yes gene_type:complete
MKILVIHNKYKTLGGEDVAVEKEAKFLKNHFDVEELYFSNSEPNILNIFTSLVLNRNFKNMAQIKRTINSFKPDYVYVHNTWFNIPLNIFKFLTKKNIRIILKLHNFRYDCTRTYSLKKHLNGKTFCHACGLRGGKFKFFNKYFDNSTVKSFFIIKYGKKYFRILRESKIKLFVLTKFHKNYLIDLGFNSEDISIFPNHIDSDIKNEVKINEKFLVYAGRISKEKGIDDLISSFKTANTKNLKFKIIGIGPELKRLKNKYGDKQIQFYGPLSNEETLKEIGSSIAVVTATKLFEGQPMLLCEASTLGIPSIFPQSGGISEFFPANYELSFEQFNYEELIRKIEFLDNEEFISNVGNQNKKYIKEYLNEEKLLNILQSVFNG